MPYEPVDMVDFSAEKEIEKLENAFADLADLRVAGLLQRQQEHIGRYFSDPKSAAGGK
jgi:hypothetical protein